MLARVAGEGRTTMTKDYTGKTRPPGKLLRPVAAATRQVTRPNPRHPTVREIRGVSWGRYSQIAMERLLIRRPRFSGLHPFGLASDEKADKLAAS